MAILQNTYPETFRAFVPGQRANGELYNGISYTLEGATPLPFGSAVFRGATDKGVNATPVAGKLMGFALLTHNLPETTARPVDTYAPLDEVSVANRGSVCVVCATATADGDPVYVTPANAVTATAAGNIAATGWEFNETIAAAGNVVIVRR
jgi:hypothetical protein